MLYKFITLNRDEIIEATCAKATQRLLPSATGDALRHGVPVFLTQLAETLRLEASAAPFPSGSIGKSATKHGGELLTLGFNVSDVVHVYGDICQAVTEIAVAQNAPVTVDEFRILNRSLDTAIAEAVTEHARLTADKTAQEETERLGQLAHELRNRIHTALLAFSVLKGGTVAVNGTTGAVLARSLTSLHALVESMVSEVRLAAERQPRELMTVHQFVADLTAAAELLADHHKVHFSIEPVGPAPVIECDPQLLTSAVMNLLENAFKFTPPGGLVALRARAREHRVTIEVEDECGGLPEGDDLFRAFGARRGSDRSGLGLGLSIARRAVRAHGGDIQVRNVQGKGCVFAIDLPLATNVPAVLG